VDEGFSILAGKILFILCIIMIAILLDSTHRPYPSFYDACIAEA